MTQPVSQLLTSEQAAERLHMSERTLRKLRQSGEIAYIAVTDRRYRYTPEDLDAYLETRRRQEAPRQTPIPHGRRIGSVRGGPAQASFMARFRAHREQRGRL
ncbi:helix-turn-helix domain-containing protein [uncultured Sphingomonas sp.]|uniref:helix-turn-helix domain-containing protein n=1 Tax=uncultured Sphingomonas sp. TaxID=158754 RepID=UPI003747AAED